MKTPTLLGILSLSLSPDPSPAGDIISVIVTSLKKTSAAVRLVDTVALLFLKAMRMARLTSSLCLAWWFFSAMAACSFSACSHSNRRVAMGDERTVVWPNRSRRPTCGGREVCQYENKFSFTTVTWPRQSKAVRQKQQQSYA